MRIVRIVRIVSDGVPLELMDDPKEETLEETAKKLTKMMEANKVVTLVGEYSAVIIRPSSVSGIDIKDIETDEERAVNMVTKPQDESIKNQEQNTEDVDMILDIEEGE